MTRNGNQVWTSDMVIGAAIVIIGIVATLVRQKVLVVKLSVAMPPMVHHLWPLLLIGIGILLWFEGEELESIDERHSLRSGGRQ